MLSDSTAPAVSVDLACWASARSIVSMLWPDSTQPRGAVTAGTVDWWTTTTAEPRHVLTCVMSSASGGDAAPAPKRLGAAIALSALSR